jgi:hypothetical protein
MDGFGWFILGAAIAVGAAVTVAVRLVQLLAGGGGLRSDRFSRRAGPRATLAWALGFAIAAAAASAIISVGMFVLPLAVIVFAIVAWRYRALPEGAIGASLGTGIVLGILGLMNPAPRQPCVSSGTMNGEHASFSCGGVNGTSWLLIAVALIGVALAWHAMMRRKQSRST